jgi:hypothetical protein
MVPLSPHTHIPVKEHVLLQADASVSTHQSNEDHQVAVHSAIGFCEVKIG